MEIPDHSEAAITAGINRILQEAFSCLDVEELGMTCLDVALELTGSQMGFINLLSTPVSMNCIAIKGEGFESFILPDRGCMQLPRDLSMKGLRGRVAREGRAIISNTSGSDPDSIALPEGHPPVTAFMGVPLFENGRIIGMIGLANKAAGYNEVDPCVLEKLAPSIVQVLMRKRAEIALRENEAHKSYLVKLDDALRPLEDPVEVELAACRVLAEHIRADQVLYGDVLDEKQIVIQHYVINGIAKRLESVGVDGFDEKTVESFKSDKCIIINDVQSDPHLSDIHKRGFASAGAVAHLSRGLTKDGKWIAALGVNSSSPRVWTPAEAELVNDTIQRLWAAVVRARAQQELRKAHGLLEVQVKARTRELHYLNQSLIHTIESITDAFYTLDRNWTVTYWNKAAEKILGQRVQDVVGRNLWESFPSAVGSESYVQYHRAMRDNVPVSFETWADYIGVGVEARVYPSPTGLTIYLKDITERIKAEQALQESEEKFHKVFHNCPDMIAIISMEDYRFIDVNQSCLKIMGFSRDEVIGRTPQELNMWTDDRESVRHFLAGLKENGIIKNAEVMTRNKSGNPVSLYVSAVVVTLNNKECLAAAMRDMTRQKMLEAELARLDRLNLIGQMAAGIGHEIRNPMTAVRGFLQILGDKAEYADDLAFFELMIEELDRANAIISEFLGLARDKMVDLQPGSLDLVINMLYPMIRSEANLREIEVHLELNGLSPCLIDRNEIRQLILNLSRNAMEAMSCHGTLTIGTRPECNEVALYIKDEGGGLSPAIRGKLGTPFVTTKDNGTGLGLPICYSIAARHHARIDYETGPTGTTFYVRFPIAGKMTAG